MGHGQDQTGVVEASDEVRPSPISFYEAIRQTWLTHAGMLPVDARVCTLAQAPSIRSDPEPRQGAKVGITRCRTILRTVTQRIDRRCDLPADVMEVM